MPGSERLYYRDSFLRTFEATVADIRELSRAEGESLWQITLNRTAFYPSSGGQPFDTGVVRAISRGGAALDVPVESVEEDEQGEVWHFVRKPVTAGTRIEGEIDWERRFDHMQQHTAQHLLSAVFQRELNLPTVSFHLGENVSTIDLAGASIAHHSLERVERVTNQLVAENLAVTTRLVSSAEAGALLASGQLRKLPERAGDIRLVEIAGIDCNACGGTHLRSTGQIGGVLLRGIEKVSRGTRVEFVAGLRAVRSARRDFAVLSQAAAALSAGPQEIPAAVERLRADAKTAAKERQRLREELADYHAARLAVEVQIENGLRLVQRSWKDRDGDYVRLLASRLTAAAPSTAVVFFAEDGDSARVVLARSLDLNFHCGALLRDALAEHGLRAGGSPELAQGEVPGGSVPALQLSIADAVRGATGRLRHG